MDQRAERFAPAEPADVAGGSIRSALVGGIVVAATAAVVLPLAVWRPPAVLVAALALAVLTVTAIAITEPAAIRACVFVDAVFVVFAAGELFGWPAAAGTILVCTLPISVLLLAGSLHVPLRPVAPWLRPGRPSVGIVLLGVVTVLAAGAALTGWTAVVRPDAPPYLRDLQDLPWWLGVAGVAGFALVNPVWEELLFRGVVLHALSQAWGVRAAVVIQAVLFASAHWAGFPSGWFGMAMAATWGCVLGIIRVRTGGLGVTYVVHVCANAVIGSLALTLLA